MHPWGLHAERSTAPGFICDLLGKATSKHERQKGFSFPVLLVVIREEREDRKQEIDFPIFPSWLFVGIYAVRKSRTSDLPASEITGLNDLLEQRGAFPCIREDCPGSTAPLLYLRSSGTMHRQQNSKSTTLVRNLRTDWSSYLYVNALYVSAHSGPKYANTGLIEVCLPKKSIHVCGGRRWPLFEPHATAEGSTPHLLISWRIA